MVLGLCAGQREALVPMITQVDSPPIGNTTPKADESRQEIFFLHERSKCLMIQQAIQVVLTTIYVLFASPIASTITPQGWYGLGAGLAGLQFFVAFFVLPETKYDQDLAAYQEAVSDNSATGSVDPEADGPVKPGLTVCTEKSPLDFVNNPLRIWRSDMRIGKPEWHKAVDVVKVCTTL